MDFNQLRTTRNQWNSIISYEKAGKSPASFHLFSGVNLDIPLVSSKLNVIEKPLSLLMTKLLHDENVTYTLIWQVRDGLDRQLYITC